MTVTTWTNFASSALAADISDTDTTITVSDGTNFPQPTGGAIAKLALENNTGQIEIVHLTARTGNTLTVVRAQEGTTALAFTVLAATRVECRDTAGAKLEQDVGGFTETQGVVLKIRRDGTPGTDPASLKDGEVAVNYGDTPPYLVVGNGSTVIPVGPVIYTTGAIAPANPRDGTIWVDAGGITQVRIAGAWLTLGTSGTVARTRQEFTNAAGQSIFTFTHNINALDVFLNGVLLASTEYSADGSQVTLNAGLMSNLDYLTLITWAI